MSQKAAPPLHEQNSRYQPAVQREHVPVPLALDPAMRAARETVTQSSVWIRPLQQEMARVIVGQRHLLDRLLIALLTNGHVLLEGVPGLAKTLSVKTLSAAIQTSFHRIQFTPDLLPADVIGTLIYNPKDGEFRIKKGPVFANLILADEINRAPAKVQSALLEAMQERQVTIGEQTFKLPDPFLVLATQNPIEQEGTYPLPEAQVDRFMLKLSIGYPSKQEEREIMDRMAETGNQIVSQPVVTPDQIIKARKVVDSVFMDEKI
jgi:MoxR-like ATPase